MPEIAPPSLARRLVRPAIGLVVIAAVFVTARRLQDELGLEWSAESIQSTVRDLGALAPIGFLALVSGRQLFALPSVLVLTSAGLLFGAPLGALLGGVGLTLNGLVIFALARFAGRDWLLPRLEARYPDIEERTRTVGPWVIALMTGHPMGVITPVHFAAGVTRIPVIVFVAAALPAALFRAGCYAFLGANLLEPGSPRFWIATAVLLGVSLLPLAHPGLRARLLRRG